MSNPVWSEPGVREEMRLFRVEATLRKLEDLLSGHNYFVDLQIYRLPFIATWSPEQYIVAAVGPESRLTKFVGVALPEILAEVEYYLRYDRGQYQGREPVHQLPHFTESLADLRCIIADLVAASVSVIRFWRDEPIEWQFSFLFIRPIGAVVFAGWGSD